MKKIFAILLTLCMLVGMLGVAAVTASAEETTTEETTTEETTTEAEDTTGSVVIRVTGLKKDGTVFTPEESEFTDFHTGWVAAATYAKNSTWKNTNDIDRVIVDLLTDWTGVNMSLGGSGEGFSDGAICFPKNTRITLNMNGHTINRARTEWDYNGEVIYIREGADVIINDGTITGGNSGNGAGGIHIDGKAAVTLNNVHVVGNVADDDYGAGIAIHDNAVLTMNGGSFRDNKIDGKSNKVFAGAAIYVYNATAKFNKVEFINNHATKNACKGAAIYAYDSDVTADECLFEGNGIEDEAKGYHAVFSVIEGVDSSITMTKSSFTNNGSMHWDESVGSRGYVFKNKFSGVFVLEDSTLTLEDNCQFSGNTAFAVFQIRDNSQLHVSDTTVTDNAAAVISSRYHTEDSYFKSCTFNNNFVSDNEKWNDQTYNTFDISEQTFTFYECELGNGTFSASKKVVLVDTETPNGNPNLGGSIFGEGSLTNLLVILSLAASTVSICLTVAFNKKRTAPAVATGADKK